MTWPLGTDPPGLRRTAPDGCNGSVLTVFRPEDVALVNSDGVPGSVDSVIFLGSLSPVHVCVDGQLIVVEAPSQQCTSIRPGQAVQLTIRPQYVRMYAT